MSIQFLEQIEASTFALHFLFSRTKSPDEGSTVKLEYQESYGSNKEIME
jgi:hypothetical protein